MWQRPEEEKKAEDPQKKVLEIATDEIKEEEQEHSDGESENEDAKAKLSDKDSLGDLSDPASQRDTTIIAEGDENEDTFMSLDEALE